ncbi:MAG: hypothetical protein KGL39_09380 [Patescibacteria group bacterium]|nr:hypothetical protein [Patescibacteria group bacterium]
MEAKTKPKSTIPATIARRTLKYLLTPSEANAFTVPRPTSMTQKIIAKSAVGASRLESMKTAIVNGWTPLFDKLIRENNRLSREEIETLIQTAALAGNVSALKRFPPLKFPIGTILLAVKSRNIQAVELAIDAESKVFASQCGFAMTHDCVNCLHKKSAAIREMLRIGSVRMLERMDTAGQTKYMGGIHEPLAYFTGDRIKDASEAEILASAIIRAGGHSNVLNSLRDRKKIFTELATIIDMRDWNKMPDGRFSCRDSLQVTLFSSAFTIAQRHARRFLRLIAFVPENTYVYARNEARNIANSKFDITHDRYCVNEHAAVFHDLSDRADSKHTSDCAERTSDRADSKRSSDRADAKQVSDHADAKQSHGTEAEIKLLRETTEIQIPEYTPELTITVVDLGAIYDSKLANLFEGIKQLDRLRRPVPTDSTNPLHQRLISATECFASDLKQCTFPVSEPLAQELSETLAAMVCPNAHITSSMLIFTGRCLRLCSINSDARAR